jgi:DNA-binding transcriptional regulator YiaG
MKVITKRLQIKGKTMTKEQLKQHRLSLGLTVKQMAAALNTPYRTYQSWELGERGMSDMVQEVLAIRIERLKQLS